MGWHSQGKEDKSNNNNIIGVLLLNATLTVRKASPNSHQKLGWAQFTDAIIQYLDGRHQQHEEEEEEGGGRLKKEGLVFLLWGGFAQKKGSHINKKKHLVLTAAHPSPLGANKVFLLVSKPRVSGWLVGHQAFQQK